MNLHDSEYARSRRLMELMEIVILRKDEVGKSDASRHLFHGYTRRLDMIDASWIHLRELVLKDPPAPLSVYQATDAGIHVNAYYMNVCGALDNLAWTLQYEWDLLPGVTESHRNRQKCALFGTEFLAALRPLNDTLAATLTAAADWNAALRLLRDPAAHRIPIYIPPSVLDESGVAEYRRMQAESARQAELGNFDQMSELQYRASELGTFQPIMILSNPEPEGLQLVSIRGQMTRDHEQFLAVSEAVLSAIFPS